MRAVTRHRQLIGFLEARRIASVAELAELCNVSQETIRRDIKDLELQGRVEKLHGAARLREHPIEATYIRRLKESQTAKEAIGAKAATLVENGMVILIDSGTTSYYAAKSLLRFDGLSVVTNSLEVARELSLHSGNHVYFTGGEIDAGYLSSFGVESVEQAKRYTPEVAFFSIGAIDADRGALDYHLGEAEFKRATAPLARKIILLADATKFGKPGLVKTFDFDQIHAVVTNRPPPAEFVEAMSDVEILIA